MLMKWFFNMILVDGYSFLFYMQDFYLFLFFPIKRGKKHEANMHDKNDF